MNTYLRYAILTGLFAILFTPLIVANEFFFPFITGKAFFFRIVVEIIFALWVILALKEPSVRPKKSALLYALVAFIAALGVSTVLAENPSKAFWSNFERMEGYISLLHFGAYFLVASSMLQTQKMWRAFWNTSIGVSVLLALYGVFQLAGVFTINQGGVRVDATFGNATYLAVYMFFHFFLTLIALTEWKSRRWQQLAYAAALVLQVSMIFYTATRGTILGLTGGLFLSGLLFVIFAKGRPLVRKAGVGIIALILIVSGGFVAIKDTDFVRGNEVLTRIASISLEEGATRFTIWGMAWQGFLERPVFGWGQEGFNFVFNTYYEPSLYGQEPWFDRVHNIFLDWLIAGGAVGLALYLSLFAVALWYLWRPRNSFSLVERTLVTGLMAGYGFHNLFVFDNLLSYVLFLSLLAYLTWKGAGNRERGIETAKPVSGAAYSLSVAGVAAVLALVLWSANVPGITRAAGIIDAIKPYEEGLTRNFDEFKEVIGARGLGRQEAHEQLVQFAAQIRNQNFLTASTPEFRDEVAQYTIDRFGEEVARAPEDARIRVFYGSFLRQLGLAGAAEEQLARARELSPAKQSILFELGILASDQGDTLRALGYFKDAYELAPAYDRARVFYAATAIRAGERATADALLTERYGTVNVADPFILQAYLDVGESTRVIAIAEVRVRENPNNVQARLELASAYLEAGRRADAIAAIEAAIGLDPNFKAQGEYYINEIQAGRTP